MAAPIAQALTISGSEDTDILVTLEASDPDFDLLSYEIVTQPETGSLQPLEDGMPEEFVYAPAADFNGLVTFSYRAFDGFEYSDTVTVELTVDAVADAPVLTLGIAPSYSTTNSSPSTALDGVDIAGTPTNLAIAFHEYGLPGEEDNTYVFINDTGGEPWSGTVQLNTTTTGAQFDPSIAVTSFGYVATWTSLGQDGSGAGVYMQRLMTDGTFIGGEMLVNSDHTSGDQQDADVTALGAGYVVTWTSTDLGESHVFAQRYDEYGGTVGGTVQVDTEAGLQATQSSVAATSSGYVITWSNPNGDGFDVYGQAYDASGNAIGSNFLLRDDTAGEQMHARVLGLDSGGFAVAYANGAAASPVTEVCVRVYDAEGLPLDSGVTLPAQGEVFDITMATLPDGHFVVAWQALAGDTQQLFMQRFSADGTAVDAPVQLDANGAPGEIAPALVYTDTLHVAFISEQATGASEVTWQLFDVPSAGLSLMEGDNILENAPLFDATVIDVDSSELLSLSITLSGGLQGDTLHWDSRSAIGGNAEYDDAILTFSGAYSVATYEAALRSVKLAVQNGGADATRTLAVQAVSSDGVSDIRYVQFTVQTADQYLAGSAASDTLIGGNGLDTLVGNAGIDQLFGNAGNDDLSGGSFNDSLYGGDGDDTLNGGFDNDYMQGGSGNDVYVVNSSLDVIIEFGGEGIDVVNASASYTLSSDVENLFLSGGSAVFGYGSNVDNLIVGNSGSNVLAGEDGNDTLDGGAGNDQLLGGNGNDLMRGGHGDDLYHYDAGDTIVEYFNQGIDTVLTYGSLAAVLYIENLTLEGSSAANLWGNALDNTLTGNQNVNSLSGAAGNDTLAGLGGNDVLNGGGGADVMLGGAGNDTYYVDDYADDVQEETNEGIDTVITALSSFTLASNVENLTIQGGEGFTFAMGNALNNVFRGNNQDNQFFGGAGKDTIQGNAGADDLAGEAGSDIITGGAGNDTIFGGAGFDQLSGGDDFDALFGDNGNDTLNGGNGIDYLGGGAGHDLLTGGADYDTFSFFTALNASTNIDTITDFNAAEDTLELDVDVVFVELFGASSLDANQFHVGTVATETTHRIVYNDSTGALYYDPDGLGGANAVQFATLANLEGITAGNFFLYSMYAA